MREKVGPILITLLLGSPGIGLFLVGTYRLVQQVRFASISKTATGRVAAIDYLRATEDSAIYRVTIEYTTSDQRRRHFGIEAGNVFTVGQSLEIAYDPSPGGMAKVATFNEMWFEPMMFTIVGFAWSGFALFMLYIAFKPSPHEKSPAEFPS